MLNAARGASKRVRPKVIYRSVNRRGMCGTVTPAHVKDALCAPMNDEVRWLYIESGSKYINCIINQDAMKNTENEL